MYAGKIIKQTSSNRLSAKKDNDNKASYLLNRKMEYAASVQNKNSLIYTKLEIGKPNDKHEAEADSVADKIVSMNDTQVSKAEEKKEEVQTKSISDSITSIQRAGEAEEKEPQAKAEIQKQEEEKKEEPQAKLQMQEEEKEEPQAKLQKQEEKKEEPQAKLQLEEEKKEEVQTKKEVSNITSHFSYSGIINKKTGGNSLPPNTKNFMESRFGAGFENVRIHNDNDSVHMNKSLRAKAFTHGNHIFFNSGQYDPNSSSGKRLLAHELTHVIQQRGKRK